MPATVEFATTHADLPLNDAVSLQSALQSNALTQAWQNCLDAVPLSLSLESDARLLAVTLRNRFLQVLDDVSDSAEQQYLVYVFYCLVRCQWTLCNVQSGYQLMAGKMERLLYAQSGMLSALSGHLESYLDPATVRRVSEMLSQPASHSSQTATSVSQEADEVQRCALQVKQEQLTAERDELQAHVRTYQAEREQWQHALGVADPAALVAYVADLEAQLSALNELQTLLGNIEEAAVYLH